MPPIGVSEAAQLGQAVTCVREILQRLPGIMSSVNLMNQHRQLSMLVKFPSQYVGQDRAIPLEKIGAMARQRKLPAWLGYGHLYGAPAIVRAAKKIVRGELSQLRGKIIFVNRSKVTIAKKILAWMPKNIRIAWVRIRCTICGTMRLFIRRYVKN